MKTKKKLSLSIETVRALGSAQLATIAAGAVLTVPCNGTIQDCTPLPTAGGC